MGLQHGLMVSAGAVAHTMNLIPNFKRNVLVFLCVLTGLLGEVATRHGGMGGIFGGALGQVGARVFGFSFPPEVGDGEN